MCDSQLIESHDPPNKHGHQASGLVPDSSCPREQGSSPLALHTFSGEAKGHVVHFLAIRMDGGLFLWAGTDGKLPALAVAMPTKYNEIPLASLLFGDFSDPQCTSVAQRLARRMEKQVFISLSLPGFSSDGVQAVEVLLKTEMEKNPEKF